MPAESQPVPKVLPISHGSMPMFLFHEIPFCEMRVSDSLSQCVCSFFRNPESVDNNLHGQKKGAS